MRSDVSLRGSVAMLVLAQACIGRESTPPDREPVALVQAELSQAFRGDRGGDERVPVIVTFRTAASLPRDREQRRRETQRLQDALLERHRDGFSLARRFRHVPALAGRITRAALERLKKDPSVAYIQIDGGGSGQLKEAVPAIGADQVKTMYGLTGKGVTVAVLDTGIDTTHPDLKDAIVGQHCFTQGDCGTFQGEGTSGEDDHGHGSNVAGIVASRGIVSSPGFAPGASLVAVKIDDANDAGQESDWVAGLDWVYDNLATLKVKVINMSICTNQLFSDASACDLGEPALAAAVKNLVDAGVTIFAASGNRGSPTTMSAPACNTGVIAVGAVYDSNVGHQPPSATSYSGRWGSGFADCADDTTAFDQITCFTNSPMRLDLVAPGAPILSDSLMGKTETYWGTSQASPAAAGVAALMLECNPALSPAEIKLAMIETGVPRMDPKNGRTFPSLRALAAVRDACPKLAGGGAAGMGGASGAAGAAGAGAAGAGAAGASGTAVIGSAGATLPANLSGGSSASGFAGANASGTGTSGNPAATSVQAGAPAIAAAGSSAAAAGSGASVGAGLGTGAGASSPGCGCSVPASERARESRAALFYCGLALALWRLRARARRAPSQR